LGIITEFFVTSGKNCDKQNTVTRCSFWGGKMRSTTFPFPTAGSLRCSSRLPSLQFHFVALLYAKV